MKYNVVDSDGHVLEPADLWERYMDPKYRDICPKLLTTDDGSEYFRLEGDRVADWRKTKTGTEQKVVGMGASGAFGTREKTKEEVAGLGQLAYSEGHKGGFDPHYRIKDMDKEGIDAAFLYPTLGLFLGAERDHNFSANAMRAYNLWLRDYCAPYPDRLFGVAAIPMQSAELAVQELRFAVEKLGFRAAFVRPSPYQGRPLHHRDLYPLWDVAQALNIPIGIHGGGLHAEAQLGGDRFTDGKAMRHAIVHTFEMIAASTSIIMGGIAERFPRLRFGLLEASGGWMAGWLDRMDRHVDDPGMNDTNLTSMPSEIFARQCFISFEPIEKTIGLLGDHIGSDHILWGTDYPHSDGFPNAPKLIKKLGLPSKIEANVLGGGAKRFYGLA
jgi:uncharacterized protein